MQLRHWLWKAMRRRTSSTSRRDSVRFWNRPPPNAETAMAIGGLWASTRNIPCSSGVASSAAIIARSSGSQSVTGTLLILVMVPPRVEVSVRRARCSHRRQQQMLGAQIVGLREQRQRRILDVRLADGAVQQIDARGEAPIGAAAL